MFSNGYARPVPGAPVHYRSSDEDSERWLRFPHRRGDIVISTRSKSGTTWVQMICALLVFQTPRLPGPLAELSPWLDWLVEPRDEVFARLEAQRHRRFIKTHTPLDGLPLDRRVTYLVVARQPLDMAVSLYHQGANLDRERVRRLTGGAAPDRSTRPRPPLREWLRSWIDDEADPRERLDSLPGVMWHLSDAWRRRDEPHVVLVRYEDLAADLEGQMRRLAGLLEVTVPDEVWPRLVEAAGFESMRANADALAPDRAGVLKDRRAFFRQGVTGSGRSLLTDEELARYRRRVERLAPPDLLEWLHQDA